MLFFYSDVVNPKYIYFNIGYTISCNQDESSVKCALENSSIFKDLCFFFFHILDIKIKTSFMFLNHVIPI